MVIICYYIYSTSIVEKQFFAFVNPHLISSHLLQLNEYIIQYKSEAVLSSSSPTKQVNTPGTHIRLGKVGGEVSLFLKYSIIPH